MKIAEHMGKGGTVSQGGERGSGERATGGRRRREAMRKEKGGELEPESYVSEHQDRQPRRALGNEAQGGTAPLRPCLGGSGEPRGAMSILQGESRGFFCGQQGFIN